MTERLQRPLIGDPNYRNDLHWSAGSLTSNKQKSALPASLAGKEGHAQ
jgi:hypothetical protein